MAVRYLEDWNTGDEVTSGPVSFSREEALAFARAYDPQPFHLDDAAAEASIFGRLAASGWLTAALVMRAIVDSKLYPDPGLVGIGVDKMRWLRPVYPDDALTVTTKAISKQERPAKRDGIVTFENTARNQHGDAVLSHVTMALIPMRPN